MMTMQSILRPTARRLIPTRAVGATYATYVTQIQNHHNRHTQTTNPNGQHQQGRHLLGQGPLRQQHRYFGVKSPGSDPLELLRQSSEKREFCDGLGLRKPDQHWVFDIATSGYTADAAPSLRAIDFQRVTPSGIDFIRKRGKGASHLASSGKASSILCSFGKYRPGETVERWVAEGQCEQIDLVGDGSDGGGGGGLLSVIPSRSIIEIVASDLVKEEEGKGVDEDHCAMDKHSHFMEVVQRTRQRFEKGELSNEELDKAIMAIRFVPYRMERLVGGPEQIMWERWEWQRATGECPEGTALWNDAKLLLPY